MKLLRKLGVALVLVALIAGLLNIPVIKNQVGDWAESPNSIVSEFAKTIYVGVAGTAYAGVTPDYTCDGTADQIEIQAAITALPAAGGKVELLAGQYNIASYITIQANTPVTIEGQGSATFLSWTSTGPNYFLFVAAGGVNWTNVTFRDFKIRDIAATANSVGITTNVAGTPAHSNILVENVELQNCAVQLRYVTSGKALIKDCYVHDITNVHDRGISISDSAFAEITDNVVSTVYGCGILATGNTRLIVSNNYVKDAAQTVLADYSIDTAQCTNVLVEGNIIHSRNGILSEDSTGNVTIIGNKVTGTTTAAGDGVLVWRVGGGSPMAGGINISSNTVTGTQHGIEILDELDATIVGNTIYSIGSKGITSYLSLGTEPRNILIANNDIYDFGKAAAWMSGIYMASDYVQVWNNNIDGNNNANNYGIGGLGGAGGGNSSIIGNNILRTSTALVSIPAATIVKNNIIDHVWTP